MHKILCLRDETNTVQSLDMDMKYSYSTMEGVVMSGLQKSLSMSVCPVFHSQMGT